MKPLAAHRWAKPLGGGSEILYLLSPQGGHSGRFVIMSENGEQSPQRPFSMWV